MKGSEPTMSLTLRSLALDWARGDRSLDDAVAAAATLPTPRVAHELDGSLRAHGGSAVIGDPDNRMAAVFGLVDEYLTVEQAHEFASAVARAREVHGTRTEEASG